MKDPLVGALPEQTNTASPALTGVPSSMTGGAGTNMIPPQSGQPGSALAPPPGNSTQVGGAPLSSDNADTRQGGAGVDLDLVKDRGTPEEFHQNNVNEIGSAKAVDLANQTLTQLDTSSGSEGFFGKMFGGQEAGVSAEEARRQGTRINKALGMDTEERARQIVNDSVFKPMIKTMRVELKDGVSDSETLMDRGAKVMANAGPTDQDQKAIEANVDTVAEGIGEKDKGKIKRAKEALVAWWQKGKDDPTEQVTGFMGGMNRQELGMFVFQWGALLMANSSQGLGPAMGAASLGAMQGHQGREATATAAEQQTIENRIAQQEADARSESAAADTKRAEAYGKVRGGVGEWKYALYKSIGWSDEKIAQALEGIMTTEQIYDEVSTQVRKEKADAAAAEKMQSLPDNMRAQTQLPDGTSIPTAKLTEEHIKLLATEAAKVQTEARGALSPQPRDPADDFGSAMDQYGTTP